MATPQEKLADSLEVLKELQDSGIFAVRSKHLTKTHRERLIKSGFLQEVMKGWYIPASPVDGVGESTAWYASFWHFVADYLSERFDKAWCLSPEQSLLLHAGNRTVPNQLVVRAPKGGNKPINLLHGTSIFDVRAKLPAQSLIVEFDSVRAYPLAEALINVSASFFVQNPVDARAALLLIADSSEVLTPLLEGGRAVVAGRLAGAFRNVGRDKFADNIVKTMKAAGYDVREDDPFEAPSPTIGMPRVVSPYAGRIRLLWDAMRENVITNFPASTGKLNDHDAYLKHIDEIFVTDAYHSLSIEGYQVSADLIERVRSGAWNPDSEEDRDTKNALAAKGYYDAFQKVKEGVVSVLGNENPGTVADRDHGDWYRALFGPMITAGILKPSDLAGYRSNPVYIRMSKHVPLPPQGVRDAMPVLFELLENEENAAVRIVLGHFIFVYIHPYMDGNGRTGRFLMNLMLAAGGYPWTVIPVQRRADYMAALEAASVGSDIVPFTKFLASLVSQEMAGKPEAKLPENR